MWILTVLDICGTSLLVTDMTSHEKSMTQHGKCCAVGAQRVISEDIASGDTISGAYALCTL